MKASRHRALADYGRAQSRAGRAGDRAMDRGWSRLLVIVVAVIAAALLWLSLPRAG